MSAEWFNVNKKPTPQARADGTPGEVIDVVCMADDMPGIGSFVATWRQLPNGEGGHFDCIEERLGAKITRWCYLPEPPPCMASIAARARDTPAVAVAKQPLCKFCRHPELRHKLNGKFCICGNELP